MDKKETTCETVGPLQNVGVFLVAKKASWTKKNLASVTGYLRSKEKHRKGSRPKRAITFLSPLLLPPPLCELQSWMAQSEGAGSKVKHSFTRRSPNLIALLAQGESVKSTGGRPTAVCTSLKYRGNQDCYSLRTCQKSTGLSHRTFWKCQGWQNYAWLNNDDACYCLTW